MVLYVFIVSPETAIFPIACLRPSWVYVTEAFAFPVLLVILALHAELAETYLISIRH
jgi:hypothetical protein